jgi:hypothetical protein
MEKQPDRKQGFFEKYLGWDAPSPKNKDERMFEAFYKLSVIEKIIFVCMFFVSFSIFTTGMFGCPIGQDLDYYLKKGVQMRNHAAEEMISFDNSAKIVSNDLKIVGYYWFEITVLAETENNNKIKLVLQTDMFGEKEKKEIFIEDKLVKEIEYPARNFVINAIERIRFYTKF